MKSSKHSSKTNWLERALIVGPHLALCTSKAELKAACKHLGAAPPKWLLKDATTHTFEHKGNLTCIVTISLKQLKKRPVDEIANLLVHEAVHVWQHHRDEVGETKPSSEFEAYSVQAIFAQLFWEAMKRRAA